MIAAVLGSGAWGTTFSAVLADSGCEVRLWGRDHAVAEQITATHRNDKYLPGITLPPGVSGTVDAAAALQDADIVVIAVPSQSARAVLTPLASLIGDHTVAVSLMKGIELGTDKRMSVVIAEALQMPESRVAVVSGPNLAGEIAAHQPTATVVSSSDPQTAALVAKACSCEYFRPYTNGDVVGVELCGAVKNVIALAVGIAQGQGMGYNTTATVITRGLVEITRLGLALGAQAETFAGLAGMGDLVATCASPSSRNHTLGKHLGQGQTLEEAVIATRGTAEAVKSSTSVLALSRSVGVEMPITEAVVDVLHRGQPVAGLARRLLTRPHKSEGLDAQVVNLDDF